MEFLSDHPLSKRAGDMESSRLKFLCSYGGKILPRPYDYELRYVGGETRIVVVNKDISCNEFVRRLRMLAGMDICVKYKLPHEDLDALVSVVSDEDFQNMVDEYYKVDYWDCSCRLRLFLFPQKQQAGGNIHEAVDDRSNTKQRFLEVDNGGSTIGKKQKDQLPVQRFQQLSSQVSGGLHAVAGSPLRFSTSAADLLAVQPAVSHPPTANFTPAATQTRSLLMAVHSPAPPPATVKLMAQQQHGVPVSDMPRMQNSKIVLFQQTRGDKLEGSHFQTVTPGYARAAAPSDYARSPAANTEKQMLEQIRHDAVSPSRRHLQNTMINEAVILNSHSFSYGRAGSEFVEADASEAEERTKRVMNDITRQNFQPHKLSRMVKDHPEAADWQDQYNLDKSSSGSSSNSSYEQLQREVSHSLISTGVSSPSPPHPLQTPRKLQPSTHHEQLFTSNGSAYIDQPPCSSYHSNFRATAASRFPAQIDESLMRQLQQRAFPTEFSGKDKPTKSSYSAHVNYPRYEGRAAAFEDSYYESHKTTFPAYLVHGSKQHVLYS